MIRLARSTDVDDLATLGLEFAEKSEVVHTFPPSLSKIWESAKGLIESPHAIVIVLEVEGVIQGFIFGFITEPFFSEELILQEMAFYCHPGYAGSRYLPTGAGRLHPQRCNVHAPQLEGHETDSSRSSQPPTE